MIIDLDTVIVAPNGQPRKYYFDDYTRTYWIYQNGHPEQIDSIDFPENPIELNSVGYYPKEATRRVCKDIAEAAKSHIEGVEDKVISYITQTIDTEARALTTMNENKNRSPDDWHYTNPSAAEQWMNDAENRRKDFLTDFSQYKNIENLWEKIQESLESSRVDSTISEESLNAVIEKTAKNISLIWNVDISEMLDKQNSKYEEISVHTQIVDEFLPSKRHTHTKQRLVPVDFKIKIKTVKTEEFPVAFNVNKYEYRTKAKDYKEAQEFEKNGEQQFNVYKTEIRTFEGKLYKPVLVNIHGSLNSNELETSSAVKHYIERYYSKDLYHSNGEDFVEGKSESVELDSKIKKHKDEIIDYASAYIINDGQLWVECGEPVYHLQTFGLDPKPSLFIEFCEDIKYFKDNKEWNFNSLEYDLVKEKINDSEEFIEVLKPELVKMMVNRMELKIEDVKSVEDFSSFVNKIYHEKKFNEKFTEELETKISVKKMQTIRDCENALNGNYGNQNETLRICNLYYKQWQEQTIEENFLTQIEKGRAFDELAKNLSHDNFSKDQLKAIIVNADDAVWQHYSNSHRWEKYREEAAKSFEDFDDESIKEAAVTGHLAEYISNNFENYSSYQLTQIAQETIWSIEQTFDESDMKEILKTFKESLIEFEDWSYMQTENKENKSRYDSWKDDDNGNKSGSECKISYGDLKAINPDVWTYAVTSVNPYFKQNEIMLFEDRCQAETLLDSKSYMNEHRYVKVLPTVNISASFFSGKPVLLDLPQYSGCNPGGWMANQKELHDHWKSLENPWKKIEILRDAKYESFDSFDIETFKDLYRTVFESRLGRTYPTLDENGSMNQNKRAVKNMPDINKAFVQSMQPFKNLGSDIVNKIFYEHGLKTKGDVLNFCKELSQEVLDKRKVITAIPEIKIKNSMTIAEKKAEPDVDVGR